MDVTLASATEGASIRYTIDGSQPTASTGTVYGSAIHLTQSATVQAIAYASGMTPSAVVSKTFGISAAEQVLAPTASVDTGTFGAAQTVTLSCVTPGATIRYTTNGSTPDATSPLYGGPIAVNATTTLEAIAFHAGMTDSPVMTRTYTLVPAAPTFSPDGGSFLGSVDVTLASATPGASIRYTTDGSDPTAAGTLYGAPIHLTGGTTVKAIASVTGWSSSAVISRSFPLGLSGTLASNAKASDAAAAYAALQGLIQSCGSKGSFVQQNPGQGVSEGTGYGMLAAVANADRTTFDGLWTFYESNLDDSHGLMNWKFTCSGATTDGKGSATDADLDVAMALVQAGCRWGPTYTDAARSLLSKIKAELPYPGDGWGATACVNPSYLAPGYYRTFAKVAPTDAAFWNAAANSAYTTLNTVANATTGLVPNWEQNGVAGACGGGNNTGDFGYDALRTPWRVATDYRWWGGDSARRLLTSQVAWVQSKGGLSALTSDVYSLSGNPVGSYAPSAAFLGTFAAATVVSDPSTADAYYTTLLNAPTSGLYFPITLKALYLAFEAGMFDRCVQ